MLQIVCDQILDVCGVVCLSLFNLISLLRDRPRRTKEISFSQVITYSRIFISVVLLHCVFYLFILSNTHSIKLLSNIYGLIVLI